jgi:hypothetical protein
VGADLLLVAGIAATLAGAAYLPLGVAAPPQQPAAPQAPPNGRTHAALSPLTDYAAIYQRPLQAPLFDPPPQKAVAPPPAPEPTFAARLIGTAVDPGFSYALFQTSADERKPVSVGQSIEGAEVLSIRADSVTVRFHGKTLELRIEEPTAPARPSVDPRSGLPTPVPPPLRTPLPTVVPAPPQPSPETPAPPGDGGANQGDGETKP